MIRPILTSLSALLLASSAAQATTYLLAPDSDVIGALTHTRATAEDTLLDIARRHNLGFEEIKLANPGVDTWIPGAGTRVRLPTQFVLPPGPRRGIVLNLAEMRVYYYPKTEKGEPVAVVTHPVSIGRMDWSTPLGTTRITRKVRKPTWYPPKSVRKENEASGDPLPASVPPGPDNPLGDYALRLGLPGYLIHGTNKPFGIGMRVSHGCVRMYPEDIETLFGQVRVGTPVLIVDEPVKAGWLDGELFVEVHPKTGELLPGSNPHAMEAVQAILAVLPEGQSPNIYRWPVVKAALHRLDGIPTVATSGQATAGQQASRGPR